MDVTDKLEPTYVYIQLVKVNVYITDFAFFDEMNEVYSRVWPPPYPGYRMFSGRS